MRPPPPRPPDQPPATQPKTGQGAPHDGEDNPASLQERPCPRLAAAPLSRGGAEDADFALRKWNLDLRLAKNISVRDVTVSFAAADTRPAIVLDDVAGAQFERVKIQRTPGAPFFVLRHVSDFTARATPGFPDTQRTTAEHESL